MKYCLLFLLLLRYSFKYHERSRNQHKTHLRHPCLKIEMRIRFAGGLVSLATHASQKTFRPDLGAVQHLDRPRRAAVGLRLHPLVVLAPGELVQRVVGQVRADVGGARPGGEHAFQYRILQACRKYYTYKLLTFISEPSNLNFLIQSCKNVHLAEKRLK